MKYLRLQDQIDTSRDGSATELSPLQFAGTWINTNTETPGIVRVTCSVESNALRVSFEGNGSTEPVDWGEATAALLCSATLHGGPGMSFIASFDLGFKKAQAGANLNQDLLVIATYHSFQNRNSAGRSNYYSREFFHRPARG
ncbi:MAG TPA: hypothetical protein VKH81_12840 [Candidatus Angelobacter sp.]|nr:hypothetical protein [Candidatus Angelobacter sp.]